MFIVVAAIIMHNYIIQEAWEDLVGKYNNDDMIVINSNDEDENYETLAGFMSSQLYVLGLI